MKAHNVEDEPETGEEHTCFLHPAGRVVWAQARPRPRPGQSWLGLLAWAHSPSCATSARPRVREWCWTCRHGRMLPGGIGIPEPARSALADGDALPPTCACEPAPPLSSLLPCSCMSSACRRLVRGLEGRTTLVVVMVGVGGREGMVCV